MTQHLIVLGFAKCGTSLLHEVLKNCHEFHLPIYKETNFFSQDWSEDLNDYYLKYKNSQQAKSKNKIFFDSSPTYMGKNYLTVLQRIKSSLGDSGKFVICLRNPVYRAFSHYKHQINAHYARYGFFAKRQSENFKKVYDKSFFDRETQNNSVIFENYFDKIKAAQEILGKDNIIYFNLESDVKSFDSFYSRLCNFLKIDYQPYFKDKPLPKILVGDYLSHYAYAEKDHVFTHNNKVYKIGRGGLLLLNNRGHELFTDLERDKITACLSASERWTNFLHGEIAKQMFDRFFAKDCSKLETAIDLDFSSWKKFKNKATPLAEFNPQYLENGVKKKAKELVF